jgi:preprotein translocase subunit SecY
VLTAFVRAFRTPDLRKKLLFTGSIIALYRLGTSVPSPGVNYKNVHSCIDAAGNGGLYGLVNLFSGGALLQLSVFALGIMPYITSSIIIQLLVVVIPRLETLKEEGQSGQAKLTQYTRYLTIALAVLQSSTIIALARSKTLFPNCSLDIIPNTSVFRIGTLVLVMTAGTAVIMWLGELITDRGIGNGMSILIFTSIAARFPTQGRNILKSQNGTFKFVVVLAIGLMVVTAVVFVEQAQRRIPVQYAKRMIGRRMYGGTSTYLPLKVNQAGVIPVIFASSLLYVPSLLTNVWNNTTFKTFVQTHLNSQSSDDRIYLTCYALLILGFTYFYVAITFNTDEIADNMKKYGGFVPGIRPGRPTAEYLGYILDRITLPGALYLAAIAVIPYIFIGLVGATNQFPFGGTAVLILVGVGLDTAKQIESQLMLRNYEGFLR